MKKARWLFITLGLICVIFAVIMVTGIIKVLRIPTTAMEPTFNAGDHVAFRFKRGLNDSDRERVVCFQISEVPYLCKFMQRDEKMIKRVAALPGDTISTDGKMIFINGSPRARKGSFAINQYQIDLSSPVVIPEGFFYVLGDNDSNSLDSRMFGLVPISAVRGITIKEVEQGTKSDG